MKKLMFAAAAVAATVAMADVTSANIVGYQNKDMTKGYKNFTAATFMPVGGTAKLGDIKAVGTEFGSGYIMFLDKDGATQKYAHPQLGTVNKAFYYVNEDEAAEWECDVGWYLTADDDTLYPMNNLEVSYGQGYEYVCKRANEKLVYAGQVTTESTPLDMNKGEKNFTAYIVPRDGVLGDIKATGTEFGSGYIMFLDKDGATQKYAHPQLGTVNKAFYYVNEDEAAEWECDVGWYLTADDDTLYPMNNLPLAAGEGFEYVCKRANEKLIMPPAVETPAAK